MMHFFLGLAFGMLLMLIASHVMNIFPWSHLSLAWQSKQASETTLFWGCSNPSRGVSLTFDDGPGPLTASFLDILAQMEVKVTFFVCGAAIVKQPDSSLLLRRMIEEGHEVGVHTWSHANLTGLMDLDPKEQKLRLSKEVTDTAALIEELSGRKPRYIRPPYGAVDGRVIEWLRINHPGMQVVMWTSGCIDWLFHNMQSIEIPVIINGMSDAGAIICLHDNDWAENMIENLPDLIKLLQTSKPQTTVNPQGREILPLDQCI
jgi:peptidoglycan/xylan/chitin deacetylase (PgdA/CDA1 family)